MKTLIPIVAALLLAAHLNAQTRSIVFDQHDHDSRMICTKSVTFASYKKGFNWDLHVIYCEQYNEADTVRFYAVGFDLNTAAPTHVSAESRMLMKFDTDSVAELNIMKELKETDFHLRRVYTTITYSFSPYYVIPTELMDYISKHKIIKIRLEAPWNAQGHFDYELADNSKIWAASESIINLRDVIKNYLVTKPSNKLYDDF